MLGDAQGGVDGLGAAVDEDGLAQARGGQVGQLGGEFDGGFVGVGEGVLVGEFGHLAVRDVGEFFAAVADGDEPEAGHGVDVLAALVIFEEDAGAFADDQQAVVSGQVGVGLGGDPEVFKAALVQGCLLVGERGHADVLSYGCAASAQGRVRVRAG